MGLVGLFLWVVIWAGWYWRLVSGCRRLAREGLEGRRRFAVLLWTTFGVGVAVTSRSGWCRYESPWTPAVARRGARTEP
jgi:hypothetical protein